MLTLFYSPGACSLASHVVLEEIGEPFDTRRVLVREGEHLKPEYLAINPHGRVPALKTETFILTESQAILTYLGLRFPDSGVLAVGDLRSSARAQELLSFFASSVHIAFAQVWRSARFADGEAAQAAVKTSGQAAIGRYFDELEEMAGSGPWVAGDRFSIADPYLLVFYRWGTLLGFDMRSYRSWTAHTDRMLRRPSVERVLAREEISFA